MRKEFFKNARHIVVKVGTSVLTKDRRFDAARVQAITRQLLDIRSRRGDVRLVLVSSGAIGCGMDLLKLKKRPDAIEKLQAIAAIGQRRLMQIYDDALSRAGIPTAQILLTWDDLGVRSRYRNTQKTIHEVLRCGAMPIINENDSVSTEEIRFGDNDQLSAMVAILFDADLLIMLTDANGLYADFDRGQASRISMIDDLAASLFDHVRDVEGALTRGGMRSKLTAIQKCMDAGIPSILADGQGKDVLTELFEGQDVGTIFMPKLTNSKSSKKHWISYVSKSEGKLIIDPGAEEAIRKKGRSLLATGIVRTSGHFEAGSAIQVENETGDVLGKGISNFSSTELEKIKGLKSGQWAETLGRACLDEVVHRDNLVFEKVRS